MIIAAYNSEKWIRTAIESVIKQTLDFKKNIQLIVVDDASGDRTGIIAEEYAREYPDNIICIKKDVNEGPGSARNVGLEYATGEYVNFLDSDDYLSKNALSEVLSFFNDNKYVDIVSIPMFIFENQNEPHSLNYRFDKSQVIDLTEKPEYFQQSCSSSFIKRNAIGDVKFPVLTISEDTFFINSLLLNNPKIGLCASAQYHYRKRNEYNSIMDHSYLTKDYYYDIINRYFPATIQKSLEKYDDVPKFIQYSILYDLKALTSSEDGENLLTEEDLNNLSGIHDTAKHIDDDVILNANFISDDLKVVFSLLKYKKLDDGIKDALNLNRVFIDIFEIVDDNLHVLGNMVNVEKREINVYVNGREIETRKLRFPQRDRYSLTARYACDYSFEFDIPLERDGRYEIEFKSQNNELEIDFSRPCNFSRTAGYAKTRHYLSILKDNKITVEKKTTFKWLKQEAKTLFNMVKRHDPSFEQGVIFRMAYMLGYPFMKNRHIWFFMDRPHETDDNGMHLFRYAADKDPDIDKYFVLSKDCKDFDKMTKIGKVLPFKSIKHRYLGLFAENIITSHPDNQDIYPFWGAYPYFAGLLKSNTIFLQHGVAKDNLSSWLNQFNMNLSFLLTSSPKEYESMFQYPYNYQKDVVKMLGLPRFDTLENKKDKRQILIMPSWRRNLTWKSKKYISTTEFFNRFNSLINNERLIKAAKENDYEIIFRPHPKVYDFIDLFDENDYVKIDYERGNYQDLFNSGSIMITDYSSVAFDFAYLYKPVIYYHYGSDYHFNLEEGYFNYESMGFGEISKSEDELVDLIIEYIENGCIIKSEYENRIRNFFFYTDKNNCQRVYDEIKKVPLKD